MLVTRFAPSPTGSMHIGNLRTLLYNKLYTSSKSGKMILRIEDTDAERSTKENVDRIYDTMEVFGFVAAETYVQSNNLSRHKEVVDELLKKGMAYKCYCTPEELEADREKARAEKRPPIYQNVWRDRTDTPDLPYTVRVKTRLEGMYTFVDKICGKVEVPAQTVDDFIIMRSDGTPTYMLAVVVDDHDEGVNFIIRGADHRTNTTRQMAIYEAMGWDIPEYAHCPLITDERNAKLSKRSGDASVETHLSNGIYPRALLNYILKLGFSKGGDTLTFRDMVNIFDIEEVNNSSAKFDNKKMIAINKAFMQDFDIDYFVSFAKKYHNIDIDLDSSYGKRISKIAPMIAKREETYLGVLKSIFYLQDNIDFFKREMETSPDKIILSTIALALQSKWNGHYDAEDIDNILKHIVEVLDVKKMVVYKNLRMALCDMEHSPSMPEIMVSLGKENVLERLDRIILTEK